MFLSVLICLSLGGGTNKYIYVGEYGFGSQLVYFKYMCRVSFKYQILIHLSAILQTH